MSAKSQEIFQELKSVLSGKTLDAILPPLVFVILNPIFGLNVAAIGAIGLAFLLFLLRIFRGQNWKYALGGLAGVGLAAGMAYFSRNAASYFLPTIISSGLLIVLTVITLAIKKPLAIWASHLTRGWPLDWFVLPDVIPAYQEVTLFWLFFFLLRFALQIWLYLKGDAFSLGWINTLLGWPVTIIVLVVSYIYGIWRLRKLQGPGVDEYIEGKLPPYKGQTRGF